LQQGFFLSFFSLLVNMANIDFCTDAPKFENSSFNSASLSKLFLFQGKKKDTLFADVKPLETEEKARLHALPNSDFQSASDSVILKSILQESRLQAINGRVTHMNEWRQTSSFDSIGEFQQLVLQKFEAAQEPNAVKHIQACLDYAYQLKYDLKAGEHAIKYQFGVVLKEIPTTNILAVWGKRRPVNEKTILEMKCALFRENVLRSRATDLNAIIVIEAISSVYLLLDGQHRAICDGPTVRAEVWPLWTPFPLLLWIRNNATKRRDIKGKDSWFHKAEVVYLIKQEGNLTKDKLHKALVEDPTHTWAVKLKSDMVWRYVQIKERVHPDVFRWCQTACESLGDYFINATTLMEFGKFVKGKNLSAAVQLALVQEAIFYGFRDLPSRWTALCEQKNQLRLFFSFDTFPDKDQLTSLRQSQENATKHIQLNGISVVTLEGTMLFRDIADKAQVVPQQLSLYGSDNNNSMLIQPKLNSNSIQPKSNSNSIQPKSNSNSNSTQLSSNSNSTQLSSNSTQLNSNLTEPNSMLSTNSNRHQPIEIDQEDATSVALSPHTEASVGVFAVSPTDTAEVVADKLKELALQMGLLRAQRKEALQKGWADSLHKYENELKLLKTAEVHLNARALELTKTHSSNLEQHQQELEICMEEQSRLLKLITEQEATYAQAIDMDAPVDMNEYNQLQLKKKDYAEISGRITTLLQFITECQDATSKAISLDLDAYAWSKNLNSRKLISTGDWLWGLEVPFEFENERGHVTYLLDKKGLSAYFALETILQFSVNALKAFVIKGMEAASKQPGFPTTVQLPKSMLSNHVTLNVPKAKKSTEHDASFASPTPSKRPATKSPEVSPTASNENDNAQGRGVTTRGNKRQQSVNIASSKTLETVNEDSKTKTSKSKGKKSILINYFLFTFLN